MRRCLASAQTQPKEAMIRFVVGPQGHLVPDIGEKLPGRGLWVCADRIALQRALGKNLFARAARRPVAIQGDVMAQIEAQLAQRSIDLIRMARKSGQAVCGSEQVKDWLRRGLAYLLVQASDGSSREKSRLTLARATPLYVDGLTGDELGCAFGRQIVVHAAIASGTLAHRIVREGGRLKSMRHDAQAGTTQDSHRMALADTTGKGETARL